MTSKEIMLANIERTGAPRPGMTFQQPGRIRDIVSAGMGNPPGYEQKRWIDGDVEYYDDVWGNIWVRMRDGCQKGEIHKAAIEDWSDLDSYQPPKHDYDLCVERLKRVFDEPTDKFKLAMVGGWVFDNARYLRKMENYFMDMAMYPEELKKVHDMVAAFLEVKIRAAGAAGADGIMIGEDMGTQNGLLFSPDMWERYFGDLYERLFAMAHDYGMKILMHSCGQNWEIVPRLLEIGINVLQFDQPAVYDMPKLAATLRDHKAALWSPVDIQKILPTGDQRTIVEGTREMLEIFQGGLILKSYGDLPGIGVKEEWDEWAYQTMLEWCGLNNGAIP